MALPKHKTCLSVLRSILGPISGGEKRFADLIGRSTSWLKKASCGQIPLTDEAAFRISFETGVSEKWLKDGDPTVPPTTGFPLSVSQKWINEGNLAVPAPTGEGEAFTKDTFSTTRTNIEQWGNAPKEVETSFLDWFVSKQANGLRSIAQSANVNGNLPLFLNAVEHALSKLADTFGVLDDEESRIYNFSYECSNHLCERLLMHDDLLTVKRLAFIANSREKMFLADKRHTAELTERANMMTRLMEGITANILTLSRQASKPSSISIQAKQKDDPQPAKPSRRPRKKK
ncbi:MAG: hypothetical protein WC765_07335 [Phycisphaerae bacterium]|jgi:hypothetical protein